MYFLKTANLTESITHLEDLPIDEFISTVKNLKDKTITEKLDGANLWFGIDDTDFFTSREGKSDKAQRKYSAKDYSTTQSDEIFKSVHLALESKLQIISKYLKVNDIVEIEVIFGNQPNTILYGKSNKNYIVILRSMNADSSDDIQKLAHALNGITTKIKSKINVSNDGTTLHKKDVNITWEFTLVKPINVDNVNITDALNILDKLNDYLANKNSKYSKYTNRQISDLKLSSIDKNDRSKYKIERAKVDSVILNDFKLKIKDLLLNKFVKDKQSILKNSDDDTKNDIEGVVIRDPVTGEQTKIVNKDIFTAINTFNNSVRNSISGLVKTSDQDAPIEQRGGVFGQAKLNVANILGAKELAVSSSAKRLISAFKADTVDKTASNIASSLNLTNLSKVKSEISDVLKASLHDIDSILNKFKLDHDKYVLYLKDGKQIHLTKEVMSRNLTAIAETKIVINDLISNVLSANSFKGVILALYGKQIQSLFSNNMKESFMIFKYLINEDDSGTTAASVSGGSVNSTNTTTSSDISAFPIKMFKGNMIVRPHVRKFKKSLKFRNPNKKDDLKLIKSVNEEWSSVKDMKYATDVDNSAKSHNNVEFKQLRNNVNMDAGVTRMDVDRYLDKAHELNNEVDCITFGLETDDGKIIKIWVNANNADKFEKTLSNMISKENDIETVINSLANIFDIVDVEWPKESNNTDINLSKDVEVNKNTDDDDDDDIYLGTQSDKNN